MGIGVVEPVPIGFHQPCQEGVRLPSPRERSLHAIKALPDVRPLSRIQKPADAICQLLPSDSQGEDIRDEIEVQDTW
jgi:hypothetical protein